MQIVTSDKIVEKCVMVAVAAEAPSPKQMPLRIPSETAGILTFKFLKLKLRPLVFNYDRISNISAVSCLTDKGENKIKGNVNDEQQEQHTLKTVMEIAIEEEWSIIQQGRQNDNQFCGLLLFYMKSSISFLASGVPTTMPKSALTNLSSNESSSKPSSAPLDSLLLAALDEPSAQHLAVQPSELSDKLWTVLLAMLFTTLLLSLPDKLSAALSPLELAQLQPNASLPGSSTLLFTQDILPTAASPTAANFASMADCLDILAAAKSHNTK